MEPQKIIFGKIGYVAERAYKKYSTRDSFVNFMMQETGINGTQAILMWQAIDAYVDINEDVLQSIERRK